LRDKPRGFRPGSFWNDWIRNLRWLCRNNNLPYRYRKDTDKNKTGNPSEFVIFIRELQTCIPPEYRRGAIHGTSLTEMISRACRKGTKSARNRGTKSRPS
jgi:hypothetical protein